MVMATPCLAIVWARAGLVMGKRGCGIGFVMVWHLPNGGFGYGLVMVKEAW